MTREWDELNQGSGALSELLQLHEIAKDSKPDLLVGYYGVKNTCIQDSVWYISSVLNILVILQPSRLEHAPFAQVTLLKLSLISQGGVVFLGFPSALKDPPA